MLKFAYGIIALLLFFMFLTDSVHAQTSPRAYWGAFIRGSAGNPTYPSDYGDAPWDLRTWDRFETNAGKKVSTIHFGQPWKNSSGNFMGFPTNTMNSIRGRGALPYLGWGSWQLGNGVNQPEFKLTNITRGDYDSYITEYARDAKAWGHPFFLRFNHEMNIGGQFSWNYADTWTNPSTGQTYKNTANDFVNMWRHVVDIFRREGANNVTWVWCPNIYFRSGSKALPFMQAYPGDNYVDWNCLDGYNKSTTMTPFANIYNDSYNVMQQKVTGSDTACSSLVSSSQCNPKTKPIMIGEWASVEAGDGGTKKAAWIKDAIMTQIPNNFPAIRAIVWFNWNTTNGLIIESTGTALSGYKTAISLPYYAANNYANFSTSPIPPPGGFQTTTGTPTPTQTVIVGDINRDGSVNILDFQLLSNSFGKTEGQTGYNANADLNSDRSVNILDFQILSNNF